MPNDEQNDTTDEAQGQAPAAEEQAPEGAEAEAPADDDGVDEDLDSESLKKALAKARKDAAGRRTQVRELQDKLASAKTVEEFQAAHEDFAKQLLAKDREIVLARHPLPDELAARLKGNTFDELLADAKALSRFVVPESSDDDSEELDGGLDPTSKHNPATDPASMARAAAVNRRARFA